MKKYFLSLVACVGGLLLPCNGEAQTIQDAVQAAITNHPQIEQAKARFYAAEQEISSVKSGFFPSLSVGVTGGRVYSDNSTSRGSVTTRGAAYSGLGEVNASLQQPLFDGFQAMNRFRSAKAITDSADLQLQDAQEQIAFRTVQAFINVLQSRSILIRLKNHEGKIKDYLQRIETNVEDGGADESQLQQAKDVFVFLSGFIADYNAQLKTAESQFLELTGELPTQDMDIPVFKMPGLPASLDEGMSLATSDHPALRSLVEQAKASGFDIKAEKGSLYPEILGELSYLKNDKREEIGGEIEDQRAVVRMNWEFEVGGGQYARIKQRRFEHAELIAREKEVRNQIERDIRIAFAEREVAATRLKNQKERIALNKKLFETYQAQFEGGKVDLLQLMQADNQLFNTEIEKIVYQYRLLTAQYGLVASLGRLQDVLFQGEVWDSSQDKIAEKALYETAK